MKEDVEEIGRLMAKVIRAGWTAVKPYTEVALGVLFLLWMGGTLASNNGASGALLGLLVAAAVGLSRLAPKASIIAAVAAFVMACVLHVYMDMGGLSGELTMYAVVGLLVVCFVHAKRARDDGMSRLERLAGRLWPWLAAAAAFAVAVIAGSSMSSIYYYEFSSSDGYSSSGGGFSMLYGQILSAVGLSILYGAIVLAVWLTGYTVRVRRERRADAERQRLTEDQLRRADLDLLVTKERDRIAQDVHDIMAHSLSVIVAQADGARLIRERDPEAVDASLEEIARSARTSLTEVRMLIESLVNSPEGHSHPTLENVGELVERMRSAGLDTTVETFGAPLELTPTQQLAVYRILQEALTNALKHAGANAHARVVSDWRGLGLALTVTSGGEGGPVSVPDDAPGRGLYGMRERARLAGGWVTAGPDESSGEFVVSAYIPRADEEPADAAGATAPMPARMTAPAVREERTAAEQRTEVLADPEAATEPLEDLADAGRAGEEGVDDRGAEGSDTEGSDTEGSGADGPVSEQAESAPSVPPRSGARA